MAMQGIEVEEFEDGIYDFPFMKPPDRPIMERICTFIYNPKEGRILGRNLIGWRRLILCYTIFYFLLIGLFSVCMHILFATINLHSPKLQLQNSIIGTNPGMAFRPVSNITEEGSIIWYDLKNSSTTKKWSELTKQFLDPYVKSSGSNNLATCSFTTSREFGKVCKVNLESFGKCGAATSYGYNTASPCVFLKLNRIYGWLPEYYNNTEELPDNMPAELKEAIMKTPAAERNQVWVSCNGEHTEDREYVTKFEYFPNKGFASYFYPYENEENYLSPLVAVRIVNPTPYILIHIECRAWAKNIKYKGGKLHREGSVAFQLMVDV